MNDVSLIIIAVIVQLRLKFPCLLFGGKLFQRIAPLQRKLLRRSFVRGNGIPSLFINPIIRKLDGVLLQQPNPFDLNL